jgi:hypothetical protein
MRTAAIAVCEGSLALGLFKQGSAKVFLSSVGDQSDDTMP